MANETNRTELYDIANTSGFYGDRESSLLGRHDNVKKFWEDMTIKLCIRPVIEKLFKNKHKLSILEMGSGCGEGYELLTHIPPSDPDQKSDSGFIFENKDIKTYLGIDINNDKIIYGRKNYRKHENVKFIKHDLKEGIPEIVLKNKPFDIYYSGYAALSYLSPAELESLLEQVFSHASKDSFIFFDLYGKYSPEWPVYWNKEESMLPYNKAYLIPQQERRKKDIEWYDVSFWTVDEVKAMIKRVSGKTQRNYKIEFISDRSIFIGRHIDTGLLSGEKLSTRYQVNRLFDHDYRGDIKKLEVDLDYLENVSDGHENVMERLNDYKNKWNRIIYFVQALENHQDRRIKKFIEDTDMEMFGDDIKLLAWLFRNSDRFPVADFWASVIGPQVAVILRNIEKNYKDAAGCGHGLMVGLEVT